MKSLIISAVILFLFSCGTNHGNLTVTTYPITGSVFVDGEPFGDAPVTISLKAGEYDVSFSEYSEQYSIPENVKVLIENNKTSDITGIYKNRFIPAEPPDGFSPADSIRIYGTSGRKLKDGSIFDYINGGGLVYLNHGLRETTHMVFLNESGNYLTVDIFDMETTENSYAAFNDSEICPPEFTTLDIGTECKVYYYKPDFFLYFSASKYLVYIGIDNDSLKNSVEKYAAIIHNRITGGK